MARVPSQSNVADPPGRGQWDQVDFMKLFAFMRSIWEATKKPWSKDRSDLERFEISPCLLVATKRPRAVQSHCSDVFSFADSRLF
jgi:hypothetical protein